MLSLILYCNNSLRAKIFKSLNFSVVKMAFILDAIKNTFSDAAEELSGSKHSHTHVGEQCAQGLHRPHHSEYRYGSFAPQSAGDVKWFVDGCGYMWAVSKALEQARESIWILDCMS